MGLDETAPAQPFLTFSAPRVHFLHCVLRRPPTLSARDLRITILAFPSHFPIPRIGDIGGIKVMALFRARGATPVLEPRLVNAEEISDDCFTETLHRCVFLRQFVKNNSRIDNGSIQEDFENNFVIPSDTSPQWRMKAS